MCLCFAVIPTDAKADAVSFFSALATTGESAESGLATVRLTYVPRASLRSACLRKVFHKSHTAQHLKFTSLCGNSLQMRIRENGFYYFAKNISEVRAGQQSTQMISPSKPFLITILFSALSLPTFQIFTGRNLKTKICLSAKTLILYSSANRPEKLCSFNGFYSICVQRQTLVLGLCI